MLHHLLFIDNGGLILPMGCLITGVCWWLAVIRFNYLGLFLDAFEGITERVPCLTFVLDSAGTVLSVEGDGPACLRGMFFGSVEELSGYFNPGSLPVFSPGTGFSGPSTGIISLDSPNPPVYLSYTIKPVQFWRKSVAWLLSFRDVSEEERDIRELALQAETADRVYRDLQLYRNTGFYLEIEQERMTLIDRVHRTLDTLRDELERGMPIGGDVIKDQVDMNGLIERARQALAEIRRLVDQLKDLKRGELE